jgi:hypothetical protein
MKFKLSYIIKMLYPLLILGGILSSYGQTFTHSGYIYGSNSVGISGIQVHLYSRTTPAMPGFTSQQNYNGHSYYRSTSSMRWTDAKVACENMGGHLVTPTTPAENAFIYSVWPSGWIGLTDQVQEGVWKWVTGEPFTWANWNGGEPNNAGNEDYIQFVGGGRWNDLPNASLPYVLEFEYIVNYTPWTLVSTSTTDSNGRYSFSRSTNPSIEYYITFSVPSLPTLLNTDAQSLNNIVVGNVLQRSKDYYRFDVNNDSRFTVSDIYSIYAKKNGILGSFISTPYSRIFTTSEWNIINGNTSNLKTSYTGTQSITINNPTSGGISNYYITRVGYNN